MFPSLDVFVVADEREEKKNRSGTDPFAGLLRQTDAFITDCDWFSVLMFSSQYNQSNLMASQQMGVKGAT